MKRRFLLTVFFLLAAATVQAATVSWTDNANNEDDFKIYRATTALSAFVQVGAVAANVVTFVDPAGVAGNCWRVTAFNSAGESQPSNIACLPQPVLVIPLSPTGTAVVP